MTTDGAPGSKVFHAANSSNKDLQLCLFRTTNILPICTKPLASIACLWARIVKGRLTVLQYLVPVIQGVEYLVQLIFVPVHQFLAGSGSQTVAEGPVSCEKSPGRAFSEISIIVLLQIVAPGRKSASTQARRRCSPRPEPKT